MDYSFIKKSSKALFTIGVITLIYNSFNVFFLNRINALNIFNLVFIFVSTLIVLYGIKKQNKFVLFYQIFGTYFLVFTCFLDDPTNMAGIFLSFMNYLMLAEYKILKNIIIKSLVIVCYVIPILISIFIIKRPCPYLIPTYLLTLFFIFFLKEYIEHKENQEYEKVDRSIEIIDKLQKSNDELIRIAKSQSNLIEQLTKSN